MHDLLRTLFRPHRPCPRPPTPPPPYSARPLLPTPYCPVSSLPHLIPWNTLATYLLPLVARYVPLETIDPAFKGCADELEKGGRLCWPEWLDEWKTAYTQVEVYTTLEGDDQADRAALRLLDTYIEEEERNGTTAFELGGAERDRAFLRRRVLDRWFRLLALHYAQRQDWLEEHALDAEPPTDDPRLVKSDGTKGKDRFPPVPEHSLFPCPTLHPLYPSETNTLLWEVSDLSPFLVPDAVSPLSTVDPAELHLRLVGRPLEGPFPPALVDEEEKEEGSF
ncbi:hypothetical protein JCM10207_006288 [Rhodosporidiobolus poonsookiae]